MTPLTKEQRHILTTLVEEAGEIVYHGCKALRFGIDDRDPTKKDALTERANIAREINQLLGVAELLRVHDILPDNYLDLSVQYDKTKQVAHYMQYARDRGEL